MSTNNDGVKFMPMRNRLSYCPHDVWVYLLATGCERHPGNGAKPTWSKVTKE